MLQGSWIYLPVRTLWFREGERRGKEVKIYAVVYISGHITLDTHVPICMSQQKNEKYCKEMAIDITTNVPKYSTIHKTIHLPIARRNVPLRTAIPGNVIFDKIFMGVIPLIAKHWGKVVL